MKYIPYVLMLVILGFSYIGIYDVFQTTWSSILFFIGLILSATISSKELNNKEGKM